MRQDQDTIRIQLTYPMSRVEEPILYHLVHDYGLVPNIRRASMDIRSGGFLFLELSGSHEQLEKALSWLTDYGIQINTIGLDGQDWAI